MTIWNPNSFGVIGSGDLSILTLVRATDRPASTVGLATLAARQPLQGDSITGLHGVSTSARKIAA
jgi:hypothetical protein